MRKIIWRRFRCVLSQLLDLDDPDLSEEALAAKESFGRPARKRRRRVPIIQSPSGNLVGPDGLPSQVYNLWDAHTNFDLTPSLVESVGRVEGVEALAVQTRYRFRLAVGRAFETEVVKAAVERSCGIGLRAPAATPGLEAVRAAMARFPCWAIYVMPDGRLMPVGGKTREEVEGRGARYHAAQEVVRSW